MIVPEKAGIFRQMAQEEIQMKNAFSRRTFLKVSGVAAAAVMMGSLSGCWYEEVPVEAQPFNKELTAGKCKVTFLTVGGTKSADRGGLVQNVTLKVENLGSDEVTLKTADFTIVMNDDKKLEIGGCREFADGRPTGVEGTIPVAAGKTAEIDLWFAADSQPHGDDVKTITATATINGVTVSGIETKENFKWWVG